MSPGWTALDGKPVTAATACGTARGHADAPRVSATARLIALTMVLMRHESAIRADAVGAAEVQEWARALWPRAVWCLRWRSVRLLCRVAERALLPGIFAHYVARKRVIADEVERAIGDGCARLVVVGAGFDALATRVARRHPLVECVEVDHPGTQAAKAAAIEATGGGPANLRFAAGDLSGGGLDALGDPAGAPATVFVCEGVLKYLERSAAEGLMRAMASHRGRRCVASVIERDGAGRVRFARQSRLVDRWLARRGESFAWGIECGDGAALLGACGWRLERGPGSVEMVKGEVLLVGSR